VSLFGISTGAGTECCTPLAAPTLTVAEAKGIAELLKALADPARVRLVNLLATSADPICVCDLTAPLGLSQPTVSHHLRKLREAGLVQCERRGTWAYYWLDRAAMARLAAMVDLAQPAPSATN
jgi:ArsR family transcriptional regulator